MADYARLLSGPKGTPVWFIDRHPMRVFKWSPDFDAYCESPIAAIWCNLIGLPIHLYDQSALYAIGKLLGTPIQIDRATANKSRLSFARLCIEIDITKPPPDEIILDICGRELVQQVKWDTIPAYCGECKHVGHKSDVCYATGKTERPPKRNYNTAPPKQPQHGGNGAKKNNGEPKHTDNNMERKQHGRGKARESNYRMNPKESEHPGTEWSGPDFLGEMHSAGTRPPPRTSMIPNFPKNQSLDPRLWEADVGVARKGRIRHGVKRPRHRMIPCDRKAISNLFP